MLDVPRDTLEIPLSRGMVAIIDTEDFPIIAPVKWHAIANKKSPGLFYACASMREGKKTFHPYMHRIILGLNSDDKRNVDHINGNGLDNRKSNLRLCNAKQNGANMKPRVNKVYKGISWHKNGWQTYVGKRYVGRYKTPELAASAYNLAASATYGEFARINELPKT